MCVVDQKNFFEINKANKSICVISVDLGKIKRCKKYPLLINNISLSILQKNQLNWNVL